MYMFVGDMANATIIVRSINVIDDAEFLFLLKFARYQDIDITNNKNESGSGLLN